MGEEQRINNLAAQAEETRRRREAEESGSRQAEEELRKREDAVYAELLRLHQLSCDTYLGEIVRDAVEDAATAQATRELRLSHTALAPSVDRLEERVNGPDVIIRDVVSKTLLPEVDKVRSRQERERAEERFLDASTRSMEDCLQEVDQKLSGK